MENNILNLKERIKNFDWEVYSGPEYYFAQRPSEAILGLIDVTRSCYFDVIDKVLYAIGKPCNGTYYPAIIKAIDFIEEISHTVDNKYCKLACCEVLNVFLFYDADVGSYKACTNLELESYVKEKLNKYESFVGPKIEE